MESLHKYKNLKQIFKEDHISCLNNKLELCDP